jgi:hypothetical protein
MAFRANVMLVYDQTEGNAMKQTLGKVHKDAPIKQERNRGGSSNWVLYLALTQGL